MGLEFTVPRKLNVLGVTGSLVFFPNPNDPEARIIDPTSNACPSDLQEQVEILKQVPAAERVGFLAIAADLYMRLGEAETAAAVINSGFAAARAIYDADTKSASKYPKGVWPSAEAYRRMVTLGVNVSLNETRKAIEDIPDPDLQELERVMEARALLGVPVRRYVAVSEGRLCVVEVDVPYDAF